MLLESERPRSGNRIAQLGPLESQVEPLESQVEPLESQVG